MKKTSKKVIVVVLLFALAVPGTFTFTACSNGTTPKKDDPLNAVVNFKPLAASFPTDVIDFSPSAALPAGVTYTLTDGQGGSWGSTTVAGFSFNGQVSAGDRYTGFVTFTQTFYYNGVKISGGERTVEMNTVPVNGFGFTAIVNNSGTGGLTLIHP